jgi:hypothetical protein
MSRKAEDDIVHHLRRQEWPLIAWLFGSIDLHQRNFESNLQFSKAFRRIEAIENITHFNHCDPDLESDEELMGIEFNTHLEAIEHSKELASISATRACATTKSWK